MSIEDRVRAELRAEADRMKIPTGSLDRVRGRGASRRRIRIAVAAGVATVGMAAVVLGSSQFLGGSPDDRPVGDGVTVTTEPVSAETTLPSTTTVPTTSSPAPPPESDRIVVATQDGIVTLEGDEIVDRIVIGPVMTACDDLAGGYVVQIGVSASSILHLADPNADLEEIVAPGDNETLTLHDVVTIEGSPSVVYTARLSGVAPEDAREDLRVLDLDTGEDRLVTRVGGYESGASQVTYAGGVFVVTMNAEGYTWFEAFEVDGTPASFEGNPRTEAESADDFLVWVGVGSLAPDGETFAFVEGSPRSEAPFRLVVVDLSTGERRREADVLDMAREDTVNRLEWNGETAVVSIAGEPAVVVRDGSIVARLSAAGTASLVDGR